jgi:hypothetical protein
MRLLAFVRLLIAIAPLVLLGSDSIAFAKPEGPVRVEYTRVEQIKAGEQATLVVTFRALTDLDQLEIALAPFTGLELLSAKTATFTNMKRGEGRALTVTVRLTEEPFGYLSVTYDTTRGRSLDGGAAMIAFGPQQPG